MTTDPACAAHPDRTAQGTCARCGTFICVGCTVSGDLCGPCRSFLHTEGVAWSEEEKARARARAALKWSVRAVNLLLGASAAGALALAAGRRGMIPGWGVGVGWALLGFAVVAGLAASVGVARGYLDSVAGRPGPAVGGVIPWSTALSIVVIGLAPAFLACVLFLSR